MNRRDSNIQLIVQARMTSQRLPGKILREVNGEPMLGYLMKSLKLCQGLDGLAIATSAQPEDDALADWAESRGYRVVRGELEDVQTRFEQAVDELGCDAFVRISGDSPLMDHRIVDRHVEAYRAGDYDLVTNVCERTFPQGCSVEVIGRDAFARACALTDEPAVREHVTVIMYRCLDQFSFKNILSDFDMGKDRLGVDTADDFEWFASLIDRLERPHTDYTCEELVCLKRSMDQAAVGQ